MKWKGQECGPYLSNEKQNCSNGFFIICTKHIASQCHRTIRNTQQYFKNKQEQMGTWLYSLEFLGGGIIRKKVTLLVG